MKVDTLRANELRLGNWLIFFNMIEREKYVQVNARFFSSLAGGKMLSEMKFDEELSGYFKGIPLTPEILSTNGFKFKRCGISGADNWQGMDFWTHDKIRLRGTVSTARGGMLHLEGYFNSQITYVHQLQNLTHALTQTELQIQL